MNAITKQAGLLRQQGAALPLVLVMIFSLSTIAATAFRITSQSASLMIALQDETDASIALFSAEEEAAFVFLTSVGAPAGLFLAPDVLADDPALEPPDWSQFPDDQFWPALDGRRISRAGDRPVVVSYTDGGGFFSFAAADEDASSTFLEALGFNGDDAATLAARIADYQDADTVRRFRGGERADYRMLAKAAPTNSPLRNLSELGRVSGFDRLTNPAFWSRARRAASFAPIYSPMRRAYAVHPGVRAVVDMQVDDDAFNEVTAASTTLSPRGRFVFTTMGNTSGKNGVLIERIVEFHRTPLAPDRPFMRFWVWEGAVEDGDVPGEEGIDGLAEVFSASVSDANSER